METPRREVCLSRKEVYSQRISFFFHGDFKIYSTWKMAKEATITTTIEMVNVGKKDYKALDDFTIVK